MKGGELVRNSLQLDDLREMKMNNENPLLNNLPLNIEDYQIDEVRSEMIDFDNKIGNGYQGYIYPIHNNPEQIVKLHELKKGAITNNEIESIVASIYASNIDVGPIIYGDPFITTDRKYVAIVMEKVSIYHPTYDDIDALIELFNKMVYNNFITFDFEYAKKNGKIIALDFGVSGIYRSPNDVLMAMFNNDIFYTPQLSKKTNKELEIYYRELLKRNSRSSSSRSGGSRGRSRGRSRSRSRGRSRGRSSKKENNRTKKNY
jgi:hypothetical protein